MSAPHKNLTEAPFSLTDGALSLRPYHPRDSAGWDQFVTRLLHQPVGYARCHCDYQHDYLSHALPAYQPRDCLLLQGDEVLGIWPLGAWPGHAGLVFSSHLNGWPGVAPPLLRSGLSERLQKQLTALWLAPFRQLRAAGALAPGLHFLDPAPGHTLPLWQAALLEEGATPGARYRLFADLTLAPAAYHAGLRKSMKSLINQARGLWSVRIDEAGDADLFAAFRALHVAVAGRVTRPESTWQWQLAAIRQGAAFAVYLHDSSARLVGASLYNQSRDEAYYAVGAYDRTLFDQPVAHLSLISAIEQARERGLSRFILGHRPFAAESPSAKEQRIAFFKAGFATATESLTRLTVDDSQCASGDSFPIDSPAPEEPT